MSSKYFRCGDPTKKCHLSVSREIVKEDDLPECPCGNQFCQDFREPVPWIVGVSGDRAKMAYGAVVGMVALIILAIIWSVHDPVPGMIQDFREELSSIEAEVETAESNQVQVESFDEFPSTVKEVATQVTSFLTRSDEAIKSNNYDAAKKLMTRSGQLIGNIKDLENSLPSGTPGLAGQITESKRLSGSLSALKVEVEDASAPILAESSEHQEAFDGLLSSIASISDRAMNLAGVKPVDPRKLHAESLALLDSSKKNIAASVEALNGIEAPKPPVVIKPPEPPFKASEADIKVTVENYLVESLILPLVKKWAGEKHFKDTKGIYYIKSPAKGNILIDVNPNDDGFKRLAKKEVDLFFADRDPTGAELLLFGPDYKESRAVAEIIALNAMTLWVHPENKTNNFEVGKPLGLKLATGAQGSPIRRRAGLFELKSDNTLDNWGEAAAMDDKRVLSLGFYHQEGVNARAKRLAVNASGKAQSLKPSRFSIATEDYKYSYRIVARNQPNPPNGVRDLMSFITSDEGQEIVAAHGYVDLRLGVGPPPPALVLVTIGKVLGRPNLKAGDLNRISTNFRFAVDDDRLDLKGLADMERLIRLLGMKYPTHQVVILGFTDSDGKEDANTILSVKRANSVVDILKQSQVAAQPAGLGESLPVDTNETELGKAKNRRAEIWVVKP
jgi:outer membrane protein OmpA-like peptidoglycan-associated protein